MVGFIIDNIGTWELLVILMIALLVFGPEKVPELARNAAKLARQIGKMTDGFKKEFEAMVDFEDSPEQRRAVQNKAPDKDMLKEIVESKTNISPPAMSAAPIISKSKPAGKNDHELPANVADEVPPDGGDLKLMH